MPWLTLFCVIKTVVRDIGVTAEVTLGDVTGTFIIKPAQQGRGRVLLLYLLTGIKTTGALGTGKHTPFDAARFDTHGTGIVAGSVTVDTAFGAAIVKTDHHRLVVGHPGEALKQANGTAEPAE